MVEQKSRGLQTRAAKLIEFKPFLCGERRITADLAARVVTAMEDAASEYLAGRLRNPLEAVRRQFALNATQIIAILAIELDAQARRYARLEQSRRWADEAYNEAWRGRAA